MSEPFTFDDLRAILRAAAGEDEGYDGSADVIDTAFIDLGYDSLAMLETASQIKRLHGIELEEHAVVQEATPRVLIAEVNRHLTQFTR